MSDESYSFSTARVRLEEIVTQVRKKDTSLEKSLDLLEEGVRLANACTELIDHADWTVGGVGEPAEGGGRRRDTDCRRRARRRRCRRRGDDAGRRAREAPEVRRRCRDDASDAPDDEA